MNISSCRIKAVNEVPIRVATHDATPGPQENLLEFVCHEESVQ
jgi:hypothetical protein